MESPTLIALVVAIIGTGGAGSVIVAIVNGRFTRARERDDARQRDGETARADLRQLIDELQEEVRIARRESRDARQEAREAWAVARDANTQGDILRGQLAALQRDLIVERAANERLAGVNREQADELTALRARVAVLEGKNGEGC